MVSKIGGTMQRISQGKMAFVLMALSMLVVLLVSPASAGVDASCTSGDWCVSEGQFFGTPKYTNDGSELNYAGRYYPGTSVGLDNSASSVLNYGNTLNVGMYDTQWLASKYDCVALGSIRSYMWFQSNNDKLSRHTWQSASSGCS
jgi:hypothetical protein